MYSPPRSYGTSPPPALSNNPFIDHPSNALTRYPDINAVDAATSNTQFTSWMQPSTSQLNPNQTGYLGVGQPNGLGGGYSAPQSPYPNGGYPQQTGFNGGYVSPIQAQPTGRPFQPSSAFGQQLAGQVNAAYGPQPTPQQQQQQYSGYPNTPQYGSSYGYQQPQQQAQYVAEFDPYASQQQQQQQQQQQSAMAPQTPQPPQTGSQYRAPHPREYVHAHKAELESWDSYAWKQSLHAFDALKEAWQRRKQEAEARANALGGAGLFGGGGYGYSGGNYGQAQEYARLEQVAKEADSHVDTVVAARFQMEEAYSGYRQSGDLASKKRVRESINAALNNLPDWPPQSF